MAHFVGRGQSPVTKMRHPGDGAFSTQGTVPHQELRHPGDGAIPAVGQSLPPDFKGYRISRHLDSLTLYCYAYAKINS